MTEPTQNGHRNAMLLLLSTVAILAFTCQARSDNAPDAKPTDAPPQQTSVIIDTSVDGRVLTWHIENTGDSPIISVEIPGFVSTDPELPTGWVWKEDETAFICQAEQTWSAIQPHRSKSFACRARSNNAVLSTTTAICHYANGASISVSNVWAPIDESLRTRLITPLSILACAGLYCLVGRKTSPRTK